MKKRFGALAPAILLLLVVGVASIGTGAYAFFIDRANSNNNTFTAASLDLKVNGTENLDQAFTVSNMAPGGSTIGAYNLTNAGTITGYLNFEFRVEDYENGLLAPEIEAGDDDTTGELSQFVSLSLYVDENHDGVFNGNDIQIYYGLVSNIQSSQPSLNVEIGAGQSLEVVASFYWQPTDDDNKAMTDSFTLDISFVLSQLQ